MAQGRFPRSRNQNPRALYDSSDGLAEIAVPNSGGPSHLAAFWPAEGRPHSTATTTAGKTRDSICFDIIKENSASDRFEGSGRCRYEFRWRGVGQFLMS